MVVDGGGGSGGGWWVVVVGGGGGGGVQSNFRAQPNCCVEVVLLLGL